MLRAIIDRPEKPKEPVQSNTFSFGSSAISGFKPISAPTHDLSAMVKKKVSSPVKVIPTSVKRSAEEESICLEKKAKHEDTVEA